MATTFNFEINNKPNKDGKFTILLRITQNRAHKRIKTCVELNRKSDWNKKRQEVRPSEPNYQVWNKRLNKELERAKTEYQELKDTGIVTPDRIKDGLTAAEHPISFLQYAKKRTEEIYNMGNIRNWKKYRTFCNKLEAFLTNEKGKVKDLVFAELTPALISQFDGFLRTLPNEKYPDKVLHPNTVQTNLNIFRTLIKRAIEVNGLMKMDSNPFLTFKYKGVRTEKKKLNSKEINSIKELELQKDSLIWNCRNYFLFSYYCAGIRAGDLMQLRWSNISSDNRISYQMGKNHKTRDLKLPAQALEILQLYKKEDTKPTDYLFPILNNEAEWAKAMTQAEIDVLPAKMKEQMYNQISSKNALINKELKKIAKLAGIDKPISLHVARHSFAKVAKEEGVETDTIQKILGHEREETTKRYMGELDNSEYDNTLEKIFDKKAQTDMDKLVELFKKLNSKDRALVIAKLDL